jgi:hypothetical protein
MSLGAASQPKFEPGQVVATPGALKALKESGQSPAGLLARHVQGDWGDLDAEDRASNDQAVIDGSRLLSSYTTARGERVWVITEAVGDDGRRDSTCLLLPEEY